MYSVSRQTHERYGHIVSISIETEGPYNSPFAAVNQAKLIRRLWLEEGVPKVRFLVINQIMTVSQAEKWARDEYEILPKCKMCACILNGQVYTHALCGSNLFCSDQCADRSFCEETEKLNDEEEVDCL